MAALERVSKFVGSTFALWVLLFSVIAYLRPSSFVWITDYIVPLLGIVMFGMGLTLSASDFKEVFKRPGDVAIGVLGQFVIMPLLAFLLAKGLNLPPEVAVGVIVVGCCPGGTASNVMTFLARGDVTLSVAITSVTTVLAPLVTPGLIWLFARQWVPVDAGALFLSIVQIVIIPIVLGIGIKALFKKQAEVSVKALPLVSVTAIVAIVSGVIAGSKEQMATTGLLIFAVVILHNVLGLLIGFLLARILRVKFEKQVAVSIEVGMQNSGLGVAIASAHFSPLSAVPSAIFSVWHNLSGPIAATLFRRLKERKDRNKDIPVSG
ncbi:bile acid:sodium symporter family protein [Paenactinomyces guangxiensis]|uniref:Bile acid:sodium symporter family protein n=1 Tax=Paenactinomyces guangxiensis TaxID=1490290 RepID=A0A7W2AAD1_9BACL|nr:bile acid:sodium symporter family protein [Paenactinomyces guangxiensis]MBA4495768.1 bile acid:sodium symporter family protein [Paenactinomyces guangxiensis]MBH8592757.1 bile acid:sodium symporter family protein [Paenactinomyces guangxiensis]